MASDSTVVDSLLYENGAIRNHCKWIDKLTAELETLFLQKKDELTPGLIDELVHQKLNLEKAILTLNDALLVHKQLHSELPLSFFGTSLTEALEMEHAEILKAIKKAELEIRTEFKNLTYTELLAKSLQIRSAHESACVLVKAHLSKEDAMLQLLKRVLRPNQ